jgi:MFS family permease
MLKRDFNNAAADIVGESFWGFLSGMISSATVLVLILRQLGAGRTEIGSITAVETCAALFPQIIGLALFRSRGRRKLQIIVYHFYAIIPCFFLLAWLLHSAGQHSASFDRIAVLAAWGLYFAGIGIVGSVWMDWIASVFEVRIRGTVMGLSFGASAVLGTAGGLAAGRMISARHNVQDYADLYVWAGVIAVVSICTFWLIEDPGASEPDSPNPSVSSLMRHFRESLAEVNFRSLLIGRILATSGFCVLPLVADYFASPDGGAIAPGTLVSCGAAISLGSALGTFVLGRLGDTHGHRLGILIGSLTQIATLLLLLIVPGRIGCVAVYFAAGVCSGGSFLSHYNMIFETCPHGNRTAHITLANLIIGGVTALIPVVAGSVAARVGSRAVFEISLALSVIAFVWFMTQVAEPRDTQARLTAS